MTPKGELQPERLEAEANRLRKHAATLRHTRQLSEAADAHHREPFGTCSVTERLDLAEGKRLLSEACVEWKWSRNSDGYGVLQLGGRRFMAHRIIYEQRVGPIPEGLTLDHLCRNHACVNPAHLEPVTSGENVLRGVGPSAQNARKTHCLRGHPLSGDNLYIFDRGDRRCRACARLTANELYERKSELMREQARARYWRNVEKMRERALIKWHKKKQQA